jgi:hypothetical protein
MQRCARIAAALAFVFAGSEVRPDNGSHVSLVPWKVLEANAPASPLILYWIPATREELRKSELLTSDDLTLYASQCVAMRVVRADDRAMLVKLEVDSALPVAILADGEGNVIARIDGEGRALDVFEVEEMVREELDRRASLAEEMLDDAREKADGGEVAAAVELYRTVWEQRCVCPRQGRNAARALKKLKAR